ncbi:DNA-binding protein [Candidatus Woesearchaeota archaeon]|nr:DNA-binding protein [Candidatus Woesearchaeota archaeon]
MELVIDANTLFSALIKNGKTAELLFEKSIRLYSPEFVIEEFLKYEEFIMEKTSRTKEELVEIMHLLKDVIEVAPKEDYSEFVREAEAISPDEKDVMYFALALKLKCGIWSNDKELQEQDKVKVYSTAEVMKLV